MQPNLAIGKTVITRALAGTPAKGMVYFLHGACDNGIGLQAWIDKTLNGKFAFRNYPVVYPSSPKRSYSLHEGKQENVWFDQISLNPNFPEDLGTISVIGSQLDKMIKDSEANSGVSEEKVIIGGFSMGGAMALHVGYKFNPNIAGVFALSTFLPPDSRLYDDMELKIAMQSPEIKFQNPSDARDAYEQAIAKAKLPKLFMSHGSNDPIVPLRWAKRTFKDLRQRGVKGHFYTIENAEHSINKQQLSLLHAWINETLFSTKKPPVDE